MARRRSLEAIWVSPHVTDSKMASLIKMYWSCVCMFGERCSTVWKTKPLPFTEKVQETDSIFIKIYSCSLVGVRSKYTLTTVWTSFILWWRILLMTPGISTTFSLPTCSRTWSMVMNVPVLPTPALHTGK